MVFPVWRKLPDLVQELLDNSHQFNFFQALLILERYLDENRESNEEWFKKIRLLPTASLVFPAADIQKCQLDSHFNYSLSFNFLGFFGVDSPLPQYFLHLTALENENSERLRHFLSLFNQAIYRLLYLAWKKYSLHLECSQNKYLEYLSALAGRTDEYAVTGLLGSRVHNRLGLQTCIENFIKNAVVQIKEQQLHWQIIPNHILGKNQIKVGDNFTLGNKILSAANQLLIQIGPISQRRMMMLLPGTHDGKNLLSLLRQYVPFHLNFSLQLDYQIDNATFGLGNNLQLGFNGCLGSSGGKSFSLLISAQRYYFYMD